MHDQRFPESQESPEQRSARAVAALQYEERAGLGYRRRQYGAGDPWAEPERHQIDKEIPGYELAAGLIAGLGAALAGLALVMLPLMMAFFAVLLAMVGLAAGGSAARIGKVAIIVACFTFFFGMMFAILTERPVWV